MRTKHVSEGRTLLVSDTGRRLLLSGPRNVRGEQRRIVSRAKMGGLRGETIGYVRLGPVSGTWLAYRAEGWHRALLDRPAAGAFAGDGRTMAEAAGRLDGWE